MPLRRQREEISTEFVDAGRLAARCNQIQALERRIPG
tara:strand:- start:2661 stop:2771 length:111 start_codon:yes stop_codon:yes gene_type:complete